MNYDPPSLINKTWNFLKNVSENVFKKKDVSKRKGVEIYVRLPIT